MPKREASLAAAACRRVGLPAASFGSSVSANGSAQALAAARFDSCTSAGRNLCLGTLWHCCTPCRNLGASGCRWSDICHWSRCSSHSRHVASVHIRADRAAPKSCAFRCWAAAAGKAKFLAFRMHRAVCALCGWSCCGLLGSCSRSYCCGDLLTAAAAGIRVGLPRARKDGALSAYRLTETGTTSWSAIAGRNG